jgi:hypothetical protein
MFNEIDKEAIQERFKKLNDDEFSKMIIMQWAIKALVIIVALIAIAGTCSNIANSLSTATKEYSVVDIPNTPMT